MRFSKFFIRSPLKYFLFLFEVVLNFCTPYVTKGKNDLWRTSYVGRTPYGPVKSAIFSCPRSNKKNPIFRSMLHIVLATHKATKTRRPIFVCVLFQIFFFCFFLFLFPVSFIFPIASIFLIVFWNSTIFKNVCSFNFYSQFCKS